MVGLSPLERAFERAGHVASAALDLLWAAPAAARWNRMPLASVVVLVLSVLATAVAGGGLGVAAAARAIPIIEPGPNETPAASASPGPPEASAGAPSGEPPGVSFEPVGSGNVSGGVPGGVPGGTSGAPGASGAVEP